MPNILFDLDGTLTDPKEGIINCFEYTLRKLGKSILPEGNLEKFIGPTLDSCFIELLTRDDKHIVNLAVSLFRERYGTVGLFENTLYPDTLDMLRRLKSQDYTLYIVTSKPTTYAKRIATHFKLAIFFQGIYGDNLDTTPAKKEKLIQYVLNVENLDPDQTLMVGDRCYDIDGANASGIMSIGVTYGFGTREELTKSQPTWICDTAKSIVEVVTTHFETNNLPFT